MAVPLVGDASRMKFEISGSSLISSDSLDGHVKFMSLKVRKRSGKSVILYNF